MSFKAILFDFNGLIIDDEPIHCELFQKVLLEEDIVVTDADYWEKYMGFDDKGLIEAVYKRDGKKLTPKVMKGLIQKKNDLYFPTLKSRLRFFEGANDFIQMVADRFPLAIVSGALRSEIDFVLEEGFLTPYFPLIVAADDTKRGKPDPEGFVIAYTRLKKDHPDIRPEHCLVLEDSLAGIEAGHRAGMKVCAMTHTFARERLGSADFIVDQFDDIVPLLKSPSKT